MIRAMAYFPHVANTRSPRTSLPRPIPIDFRHESGRILRPVVVSYEKNSFGTKRRLHVIFASELGSPLTDNPSTILRISVGIRLAVRTRLEVIAHGRNQCGTRRGEATSR